MKCLHCESTEITNLGVRLNGTKKVIAHKCDSCGEVTKVPYEEYVADKNENNIYALSEGQLHEAVSSHNSFIVTSAVSGCEANLGFLRALERYAKSTKSKLIIIPLKYKHPDVDSKGYDEILKPYLVYNNFEIRHDMKVLGAFRMNAALQNPLQGLDPLSKGANVIVGHPQVALKTMPVQYRDRSPIITTTGAITYPHYSDSKQGYVANFNHSFSAVIVQIDSGDDLFIRHLNFDGESFYDLDKKCDEFSIVKSERIEALVTGDEHVVVRDKSVEEATYGKNSIATTLRPKVIVRHDVLDGQSVNSHHYGNHVIKYAKYITGKNSLEAELEETLGYIERTTPKDSVTAIVASNHNDQVTRFLINCDPKQEPWNAMLYHKLMVKFLERTTMGDCGVEHPDGFSLYAEMRGVASNVKFLSRNQSYKIMGIECAAHSDKGSNGSRGGAQSFASLPEKYIIGHSHCFVDGHSALTRDGWKPIHEISVGELVLSYNAKTKQNVWVVNEKTHIMQYSGSVVHINAMHIKQSVTSNHMMSLVDGRYMNVCELITTEMPSLIPISAPNGIVNPYVEEIPLTDLELRKIVAYCADGTQEQGKYFRFHVKKQRKIDRLNEYFGEDFTPMSGNVGVHGTVKLNISTGTKSCIFLQKWVPAEKRLPEYFRRLSVAQKQVVIDELSFWDGTFDTGGNGRQWTTSKPEEADLVSSILVELGYRTTMKIRDSAKFSDGGNPRPRCRIITWNSDREFHSGSPVAICQKNRNERWNTQVSLVDNVRVSCLTTEMQNFWVKHDLSGKVSLTGNSPKIEKGAHQVGTSSNLRLDYTSGSPSSWATAHVIVHPNGRRQMIFIVNGKWRPKMSKKSSK